MRRSHLGPVATLVAFACTTGFRGERDIQDQARVYAPDHSRPYLGIVAVDGRPVEESELLELDRDSGTPLGDIAIQAWPPTDPARVWLEVSSPEGFVVQCAGPARFHTPETLLMTQVAATVDGETFSRLRLRAFVSEGQAGDCAARRRSARRVSAPLWIVLRDAEQPLTRQAPRVVAVNGKPIGDGPVLVRRSFRLWGHCQHDRCGHVTVLTCPQGDACELWDVLGAVELGEGRFTLRRAWLDPRRYPAGRRAFVVAVATSRRLPGTPIPHGAWTAARGVASPTLELLLADDPAGPREAVGGERQSPQAERVATPVSAVRATNRPRPVELTLDACGGTRLGASPPVAPFEGGCTGTLDGAGPLSVYLALFDGHHFQLSEPAIVADGVWSAAVWSREDLLAPPDTRYFAAIATSAPQTQRLFTQRQLAEVAIGWSAPVHIEPETSLHAGTAEGLSSPLLLVLLGIAGVAGLVARRRPSLAVRTRAGVAAAGVAVHGIDRPSDRLARGLMKLSDGSEHSAFAAHRPAAVDQALGVCMLAIALFGIVLYRAFFTKVLCSVLHVPRHLGSDYALFLIVMTALSGVLLHLQAPAPPVTSGPWGRLGQAIGSTIARCLVGTAALGLIALQVGLYTKYYFDSGVAPVVWMLAGLAALVIASAEQAVLYVGLRFGFAVVVRTALMVVVWLPVRCFEAVKDAFDRQQPVDRLRHTSLDTNGRIQ